MADEVRLQRLGFLDERNGAQTRLEAAVVQRDAHPQFAHGGQPAEIDGGQFPQARQLLALDPRGVKVGGRRRRSVGPRCG